MTYTGMQLAGCAMMCLAAGIGIGAFGGNLFRIIKKKHDEKRMSAFDRRERKIREEYRNRYWRAV